ncbi:hypothetical protein GCM10010129_41800 [Streptomyces fumigatiscleroticus]|nr:hypothetical protein GCM10010129_41800 [Streptomyces fumigatiscleroticus]
MSDRPDPTRTDLLGIYLNDHLTGSSVGVRRARYLAESERGTAIGDAVRPVADEIAEDRASLVRIMRRLDVPVRRYKVVAGRLAEQFGRLKLNGRLVRRSPLSTVLELELLRLGVEGKAAAWRTLRLLADTDERLDAGHLDGLLERARRQADTLEELRRRAVGQVLR